MKNEALANMRNLNATCPGATGRGFEPDTTNTKSHKQYDCFELILQFEVIYEKFRIVS